MLSFLRFNIFFLSTLLFAALVSASAPSGNDLGYSYTIDDYSTQSMVPRGLMARATTTLCFPFTVYLTQNSVQTATIRVRTCYCNYQGTITPATATDIDNAFAAGSTQINQTAFTESWNNNGQQQTRAQAIASLKTNIQAALNNKVANCTYAAGVYPSACDSCAFTCPSGQKVCGSKCITSTSACVTGMAARREIDTKRCALGWEVCATGLLGFGGKSAGWECVNTQADLESCGGCQQPMEGGVVGRDCTAIPGVNEVSCVEGACRVISCGRGFKRDGDKCIPFSIRASSIAMSASASSAKKAAAATATATPPTPVEPASEPEVESTPDQEEPALVVQHWSKDVTSDLPGQHKVWHRRSTTKPSSSFK